MTPDELNKVLEDITVKINHLADLQITMASTVTQGLKSLRDSSENLLEIVRFHEVRIKHLENPPGN